MRVADEALERDGLDAVTLRGLGTAAGVSRTAPYRHFADKEDLLAAVAAAGLRALREAMTEAADAGGATGAPTARVQAALEAYCDVALARPAHYRLIFGDRLSGREHTELVLEGSATFALLSELVGEAQAQLSESAASTLSITALLWSATHGAVDLTLSGHASEGKGLADTRALIALAVGRALPSPSP